MFFVEITNFLPTILLYHLTSSLQSDNVANIYAIFLRFLLKVLKIDIKSPLVSRISVFFPAELVCFSKNPIRPNLRCFSHYFPAFTPPRIKFDHFYSSFILLYRLLLFSVFKTRSTVYFCLFYGLFCFFCNFFLFIMQTFFRIF